MNPLTFVISALAQVLLLAALAGVVWLQYRRDRSQFTRDWSLAFVAGAIYVLMAHLSFAAAWAGLGPQHPVRAIEILCALAAAGAQAGYVLRSLLASGLHQHAILGYAPRLGTLLGGALAVLLIIDGSEDQFIVALIGLYGAQAMVHLVASWRISRGALADGRWPFAAALALYGVLGVLAAALFGQGRTDVSLVVSVLYLDLVARAGVGIGLLGSLYALERQHAVSAERALVDARRYAPYSGLPNRDWLSDHWPTLASAPATQIALYCVRLDRYERALGLSPVEYGQSLKLLAERGRVVIGDAEVVEVEPGYLLYLSVRVDPALISILEDKLQRALEIAQRRFSARALVALSVVTPATTVPASAIRQALDAVDQRSQQSAAARPYGARADDQHTDYELSYDDLLDALAQGQIEVWYQPKIDAGSGRAVAVEALVRWSHPDRGLLGAAAFLGSFERFGLTAALDLYVFERASRELAQLAEDSDALGLALNISEGSLAGPALAAIEASLKASKLAPECLTLEVLESVAYRVLLHSDERLHSLRAVGVRLALDDFGVGSSSLAHLRTLACDELKIDRSFVGQLPEDSRDAALVAQLTKLAHALGAKVTAEGVETAAQAQWLAEHGVDTLQGFHFARPMPLSDLKPWLESRH